MERVLMDADTLPSANTEEALAAAASGSAPKQFVTFAAGGTAYGIDIMQVREIRSRTPTTPLPDGGFGSCGVLDIRGSVVEVFDLASLLGGMGGDGGPGSVVLVVSLNGTNYGLQVDSVSDIIFAGQDDFRPSPRGSGKVPNLVKQGDKLIGILDLDVLLPKSDSGWMQ
jgi:purine-binding chemotaxis protein CheW